MAISVPLARATIGRADWFCLARGFGAPYVDWAGRADHISSCRMTAAQLSFRRHQLFPDKGPKASSLLTGDFGLVADRSPSIMARCGEMVGLLGVAAYEGLFSQEGQVRAG